MPHIIIKIHPKTGEQKKNLIKGITEVIVNTTENEEKSISIDIQEVNPEDWVEKVYRPDILARIDLLDKKPGYNPLLE